MITPEYFKQNVELEIKVFDYPVNVEYRFWWPEKKDNGKDPMFGHVEFRSDSAILNKTGYRSHLFYTDYLKEKPYRNINEFVQALAEHFAKEMGYEPSGHGSQLRMF